MDKKLTATSKSIIVTEQNQDFWLADKNLLCKLPINSINLLLFLERVFNYLTLKGIATTFR